MHPFKMRLEHRTPMIQVRLLLLRPCCRFAFPAEVARQGMQSFVSHSKTTLELCSRLSVCAEQVAMFKTDFQFSCENLKNHNGTNI